MTTATFHISRLGRFSSLVQRFADDDGYVTVDDDSRYAALTPVELAELADDEGELGEIRAAAATELAERAITAWRLGQSEPRLAHR